MELPFTRQDEARAYAAAISDPVERLLAEAFLSKAVGALVTKRVQPPQGTAPVDLDLLVRLVHEFLRDRRTLGQILSGQLKSLEDVEHVF